MAVQRLLLVTSLDLRSGYWQVELDPATADKIGFQTHDGGTFSVDSHLDCVGGPLFQARHDEDSKGLNGFSCFGLLGRHLCAGS